VVFDVSAFFKENRLIESEEGTMMTEHMQIEDAFKLLEAIGNTTSRNAKEELLKQGKDNKVFTNLLYSTYNNFILYYIKKDPKVKPEAKGDYITNYSMFYELLEDLTERRITGNNAIQGLKNFLAHCDPVEYKWYMKVIQKDLKIGITEKTINKALGDYVPVFECMLAESFNPKKTPKEFICDDKEDGYRCLGKHDDEGVFLLSRNGNLLFGYDGIEESIKKLPKGFMYDGEICGRKDEFNEVQKSAFKKSKGKDGVLKIFDRVPIQEFDDNNFTEPLRDRLKWINENIQPIIEEDPNLARVRQYGPFTTPEEAYAVQAQLILEGLEGTMVKDLDATYAMGKGRRIQKIKEFFTIDLTVTRVEEGREGTKQQGTLGSLIVEFSDKDAEAQLPIDDPKYKKKLKYIKDCTAEVGVGSGFSEELGDKIWANPGQYVGRTIEISFQEITINKDGTHSLRFPTLVKFRDDK
jgi:DNA ligase 1